MLPRTLITLATLALFAGPSLAQGPGSGGRPDREEVARARWQRMSPEQRDLMKRRFETLRSMDAGERAEMQRRFERLRDLEREVQAELPPEVQRRLAGLAPGERRALLSEHLSGELHERGRRMRGMLPPELRERLEAADPQERRALMEQVRARFKRGELDGAVRELGRDLGLAPAEVERLASLPEPEKRERVLELRRRELTGRVEREGLPAWLDAGEWAAWRGLSDREFFERFHRAREAGDPEVRRRRELRRLLRPDPATLAELAHLPERDRRAEMERRMRANVLERLEANPGLLPADELEALRALDGRAFRERLRRHTHADELRGQRRGERRRDERGGGLDARRPRGPGGPEGPRDGRANERRPLR